MLKQQQKKKKTETKEMNRVGSFVSKTRMGMAHFTNFYFFEKGAQTEMDPLKPVGCPKRVSSSKWVRPQTDPNRSAEPGRTWSIKRI
jgi:hypothetical protein